MLIKSKFRIGQSHKKAGTLCQDSAMSGNINGIKYIAVADGLGSRKHSNIGSAFCTNIMAREASVRYNEWIENVEKGEQKYHKACVVYCQRKLEELAINYGIEYKDLATTFSFALIGEEKVITFAIGDSPIIVYFKDKTFEIIETDKGNDSFANTTTSITSTSAIIKTKSKIFDKNLIDKIVISSDGAADSFISVDRKDIANLIRKEWDKELDLNELLDTLISKTHDDCAVAVAYNL